MSTLERHNPNQWGYAGMTAAMKRSVYEDDNDNNSSHVSKITKSSPFIPPTFHKHESIQSEEFQQHSVLSSPSIPSQQQQQPGLLNDTLISRLLNNSRPEEM